MVSCELCGSDVNSLKTAIVAGSEMKICNNCLSHGKIVHEGPKSHNFYRKKGIELSGENIAPNFNSLIQKEIAKRQLSAEHLAKATNIKESEIHNYLSGKIKPDIKTAKKIENFLNIRLIEEGGSNEMLINEAEDNNSGPLTLGDLLQKQMEKKND